MTRKQLEQRQKLEARKKTAEAVAKKHQDRCRGFSVADREQITARINPKFPQTATGTVNLDGHGKAEAGFKLSEALARDGAHGKGCPRYLESNKPDDEVRSMYNLSDLM